MSGGKKILLTYGSLTGNTEVVAEHMAEELGNAGHEVTTETGFETQPTAFSEYDLVLVGASTWGDGELNPISEEFLLNLDSGGVSSFPGSRFAVFGLGESHYPEFCAAADIIADKIKEMDGELIGELHKIDGYPDDEILTAAVDWAKGILALLD